jgi:uridine kinase
MIIIGIGGGTGCGKTTVVRKIIESLPDGAVSVIPQDSYYNDQTELPLEVRKRTNSTIPTRSTGPCWPTRSQSSSKDAPSSSPPIPTSPAPGFPRPCTSRPKTS